MCVWKCQIVFPCLVKGKGAELPSTSICQCQTLGLFIHVLPFTCTLQSLAAHWCTVHISIGRLTVLAYTSVYFFLMKWKWGGLGTMLHLLQIRPCPIFEPVTLRSLFQHHNKTQPRRPHPNTVISTIAIGHVYNNMRSKCEWVFITLVAEDHGVSTHMFSLAW